MGFSEGAFAVEGVSSGDIASGDCDNDGDLDLAIIGNSTGLGLIATIYGNGGGFTDIGAGLPGASDGSFGRSPSA